MNRRTDINWGGLPVYQPLSHQGILVALMPDGEIKATIRGHEPVSAGRLTFGDTGRAWIPSHKNFNNIAKQAYRDGDFDELIKKREAENAHKTALKKAAPMLLEFANFIAERHPENTVEGDAARTVIRIARGEQ